MATKAETHRGRVIVIGGSIAGLLAGNLFHRLGWDVEVFERTVGDLEGRGAGITILPGLVSGFQAAGVNEPEQSFGIVLPTRAALDKSGRIVAERPFPQTMTSWNRLYDMLKNVFPAERYRMGMTLERVEQNENKVTACFASGERVEAHLLIGADGLRSTVRSQFLPEVKPYYPGYIAWRCLTDEADLSPSTHATMFDRYIVCVVPGQQGIGYVVPGPDYSTEPGRRQLNVVWYHPVAENDLARMMTDDSGRYFPNGIPPALLSSRIKQEMVAKAPQLLAPQFAEAVQRARLHFFQPIVDVVMPRLVFGRVVLIGDAAFVARPHVAMGIPKCAGDALALVEAIKQGGRDWLPALKHFEATRLRTGRAIVERGKYLGTYMEAQLKSENERRQAEQARVPERVMIEMAAPMDLV